MYNHIRKFVIIVSSLACIPSHSMEQPGLISRISGRVLEHPLIVGALVAGGGIWYAKKRGDDNAERFCELIDKNDSVGAQKLLDSALLFNSHYRKSYKFPGPAGGPVLHMSPLARVVYKQVVDSVAPEVDLVVPAEEVTYKLARALKARGAPIEDPLRASNQYGQVTTPFLPAPALGWIKAEDFIDKDCYLVFLVAAAARIRVADLNTDIWVDLLQCQWEKSGLERYSTAELLCFTHKLYSRFHAVIK